MYKGWENVDTWIVARELTRNSDLYRNCMEAVMEEESQKNAAMRVWGMFIENIPIDLVATYHWDLMWSALEGVDWYEIAGLWWRKVENRRS